MTPKETLQSILSNRYTTEDEEDYKVVLLPGMSPEEIESFKSRMPDKALPKDIEELLTFSRGFEFFGLDEIRFDAYEVFGFESVFPRSVQLAGDGFGNFWILDIDSKGIWRSVYYVCHDPAVIVKHSENLSDFIKHVDEFGKQGRLSHLDIIHEKIAGEIWTQKVGIMQKNQKEYDLSHLYGKLPETFLIGDLSDQPVKAGFPWALSGPNTKIVRVSDEPIWAVEKKVKQGFLSRLFGGK